MIASQYYMFKNDRSIIMMEIKEQEIVKARDKLIQETEEIREMNKQMNDKPFVDLGIVKEAKDKIAQLRKKFSSVDKNKIKHK